MAYFTLLKRSSRRTEDKKNYGRNHLSSGFGRRLMIKRSWVQFPAPDTFLTLICSKKCFICLFEQTENKQKEVGDGPLKKELLPNEYR